MGRRQLRSVVQRAHVRRLSAHVRLVLLVPPATAAPPSSSPSRRSAPAAHATSAAATAAASQPPRLLRPGILAMLCVVSAFVLLRRPKPIRVLQASGQGLLPMAASSPLSPPLSSPLLTPALASPFPASKNAILVLEGKFLINKNPVYRFLISESPWCRGRALAL